MSRRNGWLAVPPGGDHPAIESAHAVAGAVELAAELGPESIILINLSGRGDKDVRRRPGGSGCSTARRRGRHDRPAQPPGPVGPDLRDLRRRWGGPRSSGTCPPVIPTPVSIEAMVAMTESGCDIIEVGVPYSDPGMDGPVIATATESALQAGVRVRDTFRAVEAISAAGGSPVVMTYWNR